MSFMGRTYIIAAALIAASAGTGFGLSAWHGLSVDQEPQYISTAALAPTTGTFVIPDFVPTAPVAPAAAALAPLASPDAMAPSDRITADEWVAAGISLRPEARTNDALQAWKDAQPKVAVHHVPRASLDVTGVSTQEVSLTRSAPARAAAPLRQPDYVVGVYR